MSEGSFRMLACASQGVGSDDDLRLKTMLSNFDAEYFELDRRNKLKGLLNLIRRLKRSDFDLFVMEGTGAAVGVAAIVSRIFFRTRYVVSSGDAVSPFLAARYPLPTIIFVTYERLLCKFSRGFIGWTPYLVGRALTFGAARGISVPGWAPFKPDCVELSLQRTRIRRNFNIPDDAVLYGIVGTLNWTNRYNYCYGLELLKAAKQNQNIVYVLIVGDGTGAPILREMAGNALGRTIFLPGKVPRDQVPNFLAAMDVGCLPQSVDQVGSFRYTTKIAEYRMIGLPFISNQIPLSYDLDNGDIFRLPGESPWSDDFITSLAALMAKLTIQDVTSIRSVMRPSGEFEKGPQIARVTEFLKDIAISHQKIA